MAEHEHDEFDDVPWDSPYRGAYRGEQPEKTGGYKHLAAVIVAGICALVIGGLFFLLSPKTAGPEAAGQSASSSSSSSSPSGGGQSESSTPSSSDAGSAEPDSSTSVGVYNYASKEGVATKAASTLREAGWTISDVSNWEGGAEDASVVYYASGSEAQAKAIAQKLGIQNVQEATGYNYEVVVVLSEHDGAGNGAQ